MKYIALLFAFTLSLAQSDDEFIRDYYKYDLTEYETLEMDIEFGLGELTIRAHDKPKTISGIIEYNSEQTKTRFVVSIVIINFINYSCSIVMVPKVARKRRGMVPFWI